jgi:hypothetical protein
MTTFLSIDMDYWNDLEDNAEIALENLNLILKSCNTSNIPLSAVMNHNQMLPLVNKSNTNQLINIDYHSDLATNDVSELNCGTWVSYVKNRKKSKYKWLHCSYYSFGDCNGSYPIFKGISKIEKKFENEARVDWFKYSHREIDITVFDYKKIFNKESVKQVCLCLSPAYTDTEIQKVFTKWRKSNNIDFTRGLLDDSYYKKLIPT